MSVRWDKYIWALRITKTRSIANEALANGRIKINNQPVKPSKEVKIGDVITVQRNSAVLTFKVLAIPKNRIGAKLVTEYMVDITLPEEIEKMKQYQMAQRIYRENGSGKPTKKDRRDLDEFMSEWQE